MTEHEKLKQKVRLLLTMLDHGQAVFSVTPSESMMKLIDELKNLSDYEKLENKS